MNKIINVLVDGLGGDVGQGVVKSLMASSLNIKIFGACISTTSSWLHKIDNSYVFPYINNENFIPFLVNFIKQHRIDVYFPTVDAGIIKVAEYKNFIETQTKCTVFVDTTDKVYICDDKYETVKFLEHAGFFTPKSILPNIEDVDEFIRMVGFPFVIKTRRGNGSKDVFLAHSHACYTSYLNNDNYMFQEYINPDGGEYTTGVYLGEDTEVKGICTLKRELRCGSTYKAVRIVDRKLEEPLADIAKLLGMKYLNIQSMRKGDILYPFEFNGRFSGTTGIISRVFNAPEMFIKEVILKEDIAKNMNDDIFYVMRFAEEIYATRGDMEALEKRSGDKL